MIKTNKESKIWRRKDESIYQYLQFSCTCIIFQNTSCLQQTLEDLSCKGLHCNTSTLDSLFYVNTLKFIRFVLDCENIKKNVSTKAIVHNQEIRVLLLE